ncbi:hypothetical protein GCM10012275_07910 [Longimycelium tulufanense]|uniref:HNH endonuclease n=1 Tax=Longimycelium tulufanense TaxID=907463 RepID=A0A8J3FU12_9PSEU|nr:hypothetical protein GCM10012275_07910 [Longimycelium tulufanense]
MPHWNRSNRKARLPADWPARRAFVLARDLNHCQWIRGDTGTPCGHPATDVDHIRRGDNHGVSNLRALCRYHHARKSSREGGRAETGDRRRGTEDHPAYTL